MTLEKWEKGKGTEGELDVSKPVAGQLTNGVTTRVSSPLCKGHFLLVPRLALSSHLSLLLSSLLYIHGSLPTKMSPNPSAANEVALSDVSEPMIQEEGQEAEGTSQYAKFLSVLLISIVLCLATLCVAVDNTIISTAVPRITHDFHSIDDVGWYAS